MAKEQLSPETTLKFRRTFQAPRERVFRAWTDPVELGRWFAPSDEYSMLVPVLVLQVGGKYCVEMHHKGAMSIACPERIERSSRPKKSHSPGYGSMIRTRTSLWSPSSFAIWGHRPKSCSCTSICRTRNNAISTNTDGTAASISSRII